MASQKSFTLQAVLKRRQQEGFVGREEQVKLFCENLALSLEDDNRCFVFNVFGQAGVGKTYLLQRFRSLAEDAITSWTDENQADEVEVMEHVAQHFEKQGNILKTFNETLRVYRQRCHELQADPEAPKGSSAFLSRTLTKIGVHLGRRTPFLGVALDFVDEDAFATVVSDWVTFVARKLTDRDEIELVREPIKVLTPLFLKGLQKVAEQLFIALFFDTYERTGAYLDGWLRALLKGDYGEMPLNIVIVIAGRYELDRNDWAPFEGLLTRLPLEPFTEKEAQTYLVRRGITDKHMVEEILQISNRLPVLLVQLTTARRGNSKQMKDPSSTAVDRILKWEEDPKQKKVALNAALPRRLNRDVLALLVEDEDVDTLFDWLKQSSFIELRSNGWVYHEVVRAHLLRYKYRESPQEWIDIHKRLAEYYEARQKNLGLNEEQGRTDTQWQSLSLEIIYHRICQSPKIYLPAALNGFIAAFDTQIGFARRWTETIRQAGEDAEVEDIQHWGERLNVSVKASEKDNYDESIVATLTALTESTSIEPRWRSIALKWRSYIYDQVAQYSQALEDINRAIELQPNDVLNIASRSLLLLQMGQYEESLADIDRVLQLRPKLLQKISNQEEPVRSSLDELNKVKAETRRRNQEKRRQEELRSLEEEAIRFEGERKQFEAELKQFEEERKQFEAELKQFEEEINQLTEPETKMLAESKLVERRKAEVERNNERIKLFKEKLGIFNKDTNRLGENRKKFESEELRRHEVLKKLEDELGKFTGQTE